MTQQEHRPQEEKGSGFNFLPRARLEMLSDLIFGLSLSIGAITLIGTTTYTQASIVNRMISFIFNFTIIIMIWIRYTGTMTILPVETARVVFLNLLMLLLVGLEPFLLSIVQDSLFVNAQVDYELASFASTLYALDIGGLVAIQGFFTHILSREEMGLVPTSLLHNYRVGRNALFFLAGFFVITALPLPAIFNGNFLVLGLPLRIQLWWIPLFGSIFLIAGKYGLGGIPRRQDP